MNIKSFIKEINYQNLDIYEEEDLKKKITDSVSCMEENGDSYATLETTYWDYAFNPEMMNGEYEEVIQGKFLIFNGFISESRKEKVFSIVKDGIAPLVKVVHYGKETDNKKSFVICFYSNFDEKQMADIAEWLIDNDFIIHNRNGNFRDVPYKFEQQTKTDKYTSNGKYKTGKYSLSSFIDLETGNRR